jgi:glucose-1-phosphate cytidylyltransferase
MKVVILAGGLGTRISEETEDKPKPMVLINDKPLIWHLMNIFAKQGYNEFIIATGYKGEVIHNWVSGLKHNNSESSWEISILDTGLDTQTGGRIAICMRSVPGERVIATYGDGLANVSISDLIKFHELNDKLATVTAVRPPARFGALKLKGNSVSYFREKSRMDEGWINGGFFVVSGRFLDLIKNDKTYLEREPLETVTKLKQLSAYRHNGFWQCIDNMRDLISINKKIKEKKIIL